MILPWTQIDGQLRLTIWAAGVHKEEEDGRLVGATALGCSRSRPTSDRESVYDSEHWRQAQRSCRPIDNHFCPEFQIGEFEKGLQLIHKASSKSRVNMDGAIRPLGIVRNRTIEMVTFRDQPLQPMEPNEETRFRPVRMAPERESPLSPFFQAATEIKREIAEMQAAFERLGHHQERSLRPAFGDIGESLREINEITSAIGSKMRIVSQRINGLRLPAGNPPDRVCIVDNFAKLYRLPIELFPEIIKFQSRFFL
jgi:hypothetical protein